MILKALSRRLLDAVLSVWAVATLAFVLLHLAPGDPLSSSLAEARIPSAVRAQWRDRLALDRSISQQYVGYVSALAQGDLGFSWSRQRSVKAVLRDALPHSVMLVACAILLAALTGVGIGTWQAVRRDSRAERAVSALQGLLAGVPESWLALMLLGLLGAEWGWFPLNGRCDPLTCGQLSGWPAAADLLRHATLPVLTLTLLLIVPFARLQRVAVSAVLHDAVVRTASAKGLPTWPLLRRHILRRAAQPVLVAISLALPATVGGAVVIERIFGWPGMGLVLVDAVAMRDYPLVTAAAALSAILVVAGALLVDVTLHRLDPRLSSTMRP